MEKANDQNTPKVSTIIEVSPQKLRTIADRLELAAKHAYPGQEIQYDFSRTLTFRYDPELSSASPRFPMVDGSAVSEGGVSE